MEILNNLIEDKHYNKSIKVMKMNKLTENNRIKIIKTIKQKDNLMLI